MAALGILSVLLERSVVTVHVHEEDTFHDVLRLHWCVCGYEKRQDGRWTPPRTMEGFIRRSRAWKEEEVQG